MKKLLSILLAGAMTLAPVSALAKSESLIDTNIAYMRQLLNESEFRVYRANSADNYVYYGAKFEPRSGVYIGTPEDKKYSGVSNAINTEYSWFEASESNKNWNCKRVERAEAPSDHARLVGVNWNFASQTYVDMTEYANYVRNFIDGLASRGEDILLIFGKEMNIDDNFIDENTFIDAFRYVADYAHTKQNIAMVWAPNDTGGLDTRLIDFYPGNDYVDWIGCSLYSMPYFLDDPNTPDASNVGFIMGPYANPVMRAKVIARFMEQNGINKPVCITEGGVGWYSPKTSTDYTDWASQQLRRYYGEICRRYPQFKCIVSFNNTYSGDFYRYDMGNNPTLASIYKQLTADPMYLKSYPSEASVAYTEIGDHETFTDTIELSAYAYAPKTEWITVRYEIDGAQVAETAYPPYNLTLDSSQVSPGEHTITAKEFIGDRQISSKSTKINFTETPKPTTVTTSFGAEVSEWAAPEIELAFKNNLIPEVMLNFNLTEKVNRGEFAAIALQLYDVLTKSEAETPSSNPFADISGDINEKAIKKAYGLGITDGTSKTTYEPLSFITREQLATMLCRTVKKYNVPDWTLENDDDYYLDTSGVKLFADDGDISDWAKPSVYFMSKFGIVQGIDDTHFAPKNTTTQQEASGYATATREQAIILAQRIFKVSDIWN